MLFYISVVKNNFLAKKKKIRGQNLKIHPRMSIGLNDLKNGYTKYFKNCISHDGLGPLSKILAVNWWSFYCTTYNKITILRGFSVNTAAAAEPKNKFRHPTLLSSLGSTPAESSKSTQRS